MYKKAIIVVIIEGLIFVLALLSRLVPAGFTAFVCSDGADGPPRGDGDDFMVATRGRGAPPLAPLRWPPTEGVMVGFGVAAAAVAPVSDCIDLVRRPPPSFLLRGFAVPSYVAADRGGRILAGLRTGLVTGF